jgi:GAF domain-containing protein
MERIKQIIRNINILANDPESSIEGILSAISGGVHDYFRADEGNVGQFFCYIVLYQTYLPLRLAAVNPSNYRDALKTALEKASEQNNIGLSYQAYRSRESQRTGDVINSKYYVAHNSPDLPPTCSQLSVPIIAYRRRPRPEHSLETIGVISIESDTTDAFSAEHQLAIELLADYAAGIIDSRRIALSLEALQAATQKLSSALSLDTVKAICESVVGMAVEILHSLHQEVAYCHVGLLETAGDDRILRFEASFDSDSKLSQALGSTNINLDHPDKGKAGIVGRCILQNETINVGDVREDKDYIILDERVRSQLAIPIRFEDAILGAISIEYFEAHAFDMNEQRILESLAAAAAIAIQNLRLRLALQVISAAAATYQDISDILMLVREKTIDMASFRQGKSVQAAIGIVSKEGGVRYDYPLIAEGSGTLLLKVGQGLSHRVIRSGNEVYSPNVKRDFDYVARTEDTISEFLAPIMLGKTVIAILSIQSSAEDAFSEYSFQMVRLFAQQAAIAIRNHRLFRALRKLHEISSQSTSILGKTTGVDVMTTEQLPLMEGYEALDETENTDTQTFASIADETSSRLLMNAVDEQDLAILLFKRARDIVAFNQEAQFENMLVAFIPSDEEKIVHLYDFAQFDKNKKPNYEQHPLSELTIISSTVRRLSIITSNHDKLPSLEAYQDYESYVFAPMVLDTVCVGAIGIFGHRKDAFNQDDEWILQSIADRAAEAYSNFRRVRRLSEGVLALNEIDNRIVKLLVSEDETSSEKGLTAIWEFIVDKALILSEAEGSSLYLYRVATNTIEKIADKGLYHNSPVGQHYRLEEEGLVSTLAARSKAITTQVDLKTLPRSETNLSALAIPLLADEREFGEEADGQLGLIGVLTVRSQRENAFNNEKVDMLKALAGQAVVAMRYAKLLARMGDLFNTNLKLSTLSYEQAAETILEKALEFISPKVGLRGMVYRLDIADAQLHRLYDVGFDESDANFLLKTAELSLSSRNGISEAAYYRKLNAVKDVQADERYKPYYQNSNVRSLISIAIYGSRESLEGSSEPPKVLRGVLVVMSSQPNVFNRIDRRLLIYFANQVELAWSYVAQRTRMVNLATINQEWGQIASEEKSGREETWASLRVWEKVKVLIGADAGVIFEQHHGKGSLTVADNRHLAPNFKELQPEIQVGQGIAGWVAATQKALNIPDVDELPRIEFGEAEEAPENQLYYMTGLYHTKPSHNLGDTFMALASQSALAVPMFDRESKFRGLIQVESPVPHAFDANDMRFLQVLANQAWSVMDTREKQRKQWEADVLPTFFAMLHDQKGMLQGLRLLLKSEALDKNQRFGASINNLQSYVNFIEEAHSAFHELGAESHHSPSDILPIPEALNYIHKQYKGMYPTLADSFQIKLENCENRCVLMDMRLIYVFRNLISNAVAYAKPPYILGATVETRTDMIVFYIEDAGPGLEKAMLEKVFEPKFGKDSDGWGLGLWFTQMFVESLGGVIEVSSAPNHPTRFTFWIPTAQCVIGD